MRTSRHEPPTPIMIDHEFASTIVSTYCIVIIHTKKGPPSKVSKRGWVVSSEREKDREREKEKEREEPTISS